MSITLAAIGFHSAELLNPKVSVVLPRELGPSELSAWRGMQAADSRLRSPFLAPEFALAVDRVRRDARVAVLEDSGRVVGFLAYQAGRFGAGRPIGASLCDCQGLVALAGIRFDAMSLLRGCGLSVLEFDHLLASQATFAGHHVARTESYVMDLSQGYDAYLAERMSHSRKSLRKTFDKRRDLEAEVGEVSFELRSSNAQDLAALMKLKSAQFRRSGWPDRFSEGWVRALVEELFGAEGGGCVGMLSVLRAGGLPVAYIYALAGQGMLATWFPAYDPVFGRQSPGLILHLRLAEAVAPLGVDTIDLGRGQEWYKDKLKTHDVALAEAWVARPGAGALLRRLERAPRDKVWGYVISHERLRRPARWVLRQAMSLGRRR